MRGDAASRASFAGDRQQAYKEAPLGVAVGREAYCEELLDMEPPGKGVRVQSRNGITAS